MKPDCAAHPKPALVVTPVETVGLRAGLGNLLVLMAVIAASMAYSGTRDAGMGLPLALVLSAAAAGVFLLAYTTVVSKVERGPDSIVFTCSLRRFRFPIADLEKVSILPLAPSRFFLIWLRLESKRLPRIFHFAAFSTSSGSFEETRRSLRDLLRVRGL